MNKKLKALIMVFTLTLVGFIGIGPVDAGTIKGHCCSKTFKVTTNYKNYVLTGSLHKDCTTDHNYSYQTYATSSSTKRAYCLQKGVAITTHNSSYSKVTTLKTDSEGSKSIYIARAIGFSGNGVSSPCGDTSLAGGLLVQMINKNYNSGAWKNLTSSKIDFTNDTGIESKLLTLIDKVILYRKIPSFAYGSQSTAESNQKYLSYNSSTGKYSLTLTDSEGVLKLFGMKVKSLNSNLTATRDGNKLTVSGTKANLAGKTKMCVRLTKEDMPVGTLYKDTTSQDTAVLLDKDTKDINYYVCFRAREAKVTKTDSKTKKLSGATIGLYTTSNCSGTAKYKAKTGSDGIAHFYLSGSTTYYAKETVAPSGYKLSSTCAKIKSDAATIKNDVNKITVKKTDDKDALIKSSQTIFKLYSDSTCKTLAKTAAGNTVKAKGTTNGTLTFEGLAKGTYYVKETTPPNGYKISEKNCKSVTENGTVTFSNKPIQKTELQVFKKDKYKESKNQDSAMQGVKIGIFDDEKCTTPSTNLGSTETQTVKTTDESGIASWNGLECKAGSSSTTRTLYVKETETPNRYIQDDKQCKKVTVQCATTTETVSVDNSVEIFNQPYGDIKIYKKDAETDKPLEKVEFMLLNEKKEPATDKDGKKITVSATNAKGYAEFKNVLYGKYYIKETTFLPGYKKLTEPIEFVLNENTDSYKLAREKDTKYIVGDINGDSEITAEDKTMLQELIAVDNGLGLKPVQTKAGDINEDQLVDGQDVNLLEKYTLNSENKELLKTYSDGKKELCKNTETTTECIKLINNLANAYDNIYIKNQATPSETTNPTQTTSIGKQSIAPTLLADEEDVVEGETDGEDENEGEPDEPDEPSEPDEPDEPDEPSEPDEPDEPDEPTISLVGDLTNDGKIDTNDVTKIESLMNSETPDLNADFNGDGKVTATDKEILMMYIQYSSTMATSVAEFVEAHDRLIASGGEGFTEEKIITLLNVGKAGVIPYEEAIASMVVINEKIGITISKQDITSKEEVAGATIVIKDSDGKVFKKYKSQRTPTTFTIPEGTYTLTEILAPKGYKDLQTTIKFKVDNEGNVKLLSATSNMYKVTKLNEDSSNINHLIIYNELIKKQKVKIPNTASSTKIILLIAGCGLIGGSCYIAYTRFYGKKPIKK